MRVLACSQPRFVQAFRSLRQRREPGRWPTLHRRFIFFATFPNAVQFRTLVHRPNRPQPFAGGGAGPLPQFPAGEAHPDDNFRACFSQGQCRLRHRPARGNDVVDEENRAAPLRTLWGEPQRRPAVQRLALLRATPALEQIDHSQAVPTPIRPRQPLGRVVASPTAMDRRSRRPRDHRRSRVRPLRRAKERSAHQPEPPVGRRGLRRKHQVLDRPLIGEQAPQGVETGRNRAIRRRHETSRTRTAPSRTAS